MTFVLLAAGYWHHASGNHGLGGTLQIVGIIPSEGKVLKLTLVKASGAFGFMACMAGWYDFYSNSLGIRMSANAFHEIGGYSSRKCSHPLISLFSCRSAI